MRVLSLHSGVTINHPEPGLAWMSQTLSHGENFVPDELAEPWFAYHSDPAHVFPLVADGTISKMADEDAAAEAKPDPPAEPKAPTEPEPEPAKPAKDPA